MRRILLVLLLICLAGGGGLSAAPLLQAPIAPLTPGTPLEGELTETQRALQYAFDGTAGQSVVISMQTLSGDLDAYLSLATFNGELLAEDDNSGGGTDALLTFTLPESASYIITATHSRDAAPPGVGSFSLQLGLDGEGALPGLPSAPQPALAVGARMQPLPRGEQVRGALSESARFTLYWFEGTAEETITLVPEPGTSLQAQLVLYNASFNELGRNVPGSPLSANLPAAGVYFVKVGLPVEGSLGGNYAFTLGDAASLAPTAPPREVQPGQTAIAYGETVSGAISDTITSYSFQFSGNEGDSISISMLRAGGNLDSYLYLFTSGGAVVAQDDNSGGPNGDARIETTLPGAGDYLIIATRLNEDAGITTGNFLLTLNAANQDSSTPSPQSSDASGLLPSPAAGAALPPALASFPQLRVGEAVTGLIANSTYLVPHVFYAEAGQALELRLENLSGDLDPYLLLLDADQLVLAENDDIVAGENRDSLLNFTPEQSAYYIALATRFEQEAGTSSGEFRLSILAGVGDEAGGAAEGLLTASAITENPNITRFNPSILTPDNAAEGTLANLQFADSYAFRISVPGSPIDLSAVAADESPLTLILTTDRLQALASTDDGLLSAVSIDNPGDYLLFVAPASGTATPAALTYTLSLLAPAESAAATAPTTEEAPDATLEASPDAAPDATEEVAAVLPLSYGERVTGTISNDANNQDYRFTGAADDIVRIRMNALGAALDPLVELRDANGNLIEANDDIEAGVQRNALLQVTLPRDGDYIVRATHFIPSDGTPATEGDYELILERVDPAAVGISPLVLPIQPGQAVEGEINAEQSLLFYSFNATTGDLTTIEVSTLSGNLDAVLYLYGYTSAGDPIELTSNDDSPRGNTFDPLIENYAIPRSGTYLIAVGRFPGEESPTSGEFRLTLRLQAPTDDE